MQAGRLVVLAGVMLLLTACKQDAKDTAADSVAVDPMQQQASMNGNAQMAASDRTDTQVPTQGGAFARQPNFQLPAPVSNAPVQGTASSGSRSRQIDVAGVTDAVLKGLNGTGSNVQVRINPGGIVALSGEVENIAQLQRAQYLARAQPGVVEVDYRNLRVRQR